MTILISGKQGSGKSRIARLLYELLNQSGFFIVKIYTTNEDIAIPASAYLEDPS